MKTKIIKVSSPKLDLKCRCECGQRLRIVWVCWKGGKMVDIGVLKGQEKQPRLGVVLREKDIDKLKKFLNKY